MDDVDLKLSIAEPLRSIDSELWDKLAGTDNPFLSHAFLSAIEEGGAVGGNSGWNPMHVLLKNKSGHLMGAMPFYLKYHSYGEYIFDQSWADALNRAGGSYYPKLLCAVPFTPVSGPRFLALNDREDLKKILANGVIQLTNKYQLSSAHINFIQPGDNTFLNGDEWLIRSGLQFHWYNDGYKDFDDFLANLSARKRKNIRKERAAVNNAGIRITRLSGAAIKTEHINDFYRFYLSTINRKWGGAYLTHATFHKLHQTMAEKMLLIMAELDGRIIGGALNFIGKDTLYGRNWGADLDIPFLHFEACYYQAIDYAIEKRLHKVEAGAQGVHKLQRGYLPVKTKSAHYIANKEFRNAVKKFLEVEQHGIENEEYHINLSSPYKTAQKE